MIDDGLPALVAQLADVCRAKGVRVLDAHGLRLELGPVESPLKADTARADPDMCKCGHEAHVHMNGLCTRGCDVEKCIPEGAA